MEWVLGAIVVLGVFALVGAALQRRRLRRIGELAEATPLEIVNVILSDEGAAPILGPILGWYVKYRYVDADGGVHTSTSEVLNEDPHLYLVDGKGKARYDREHPERSAWVTPPAGPSAIDLIRVWYRTLGR